MKYSKMRKETYKYLIYLKNEKDFLELTYKFLVRK